MDFSLSDEQRAMAELAGQILKDRSTSERLKAVEASTERIDRDTWTEFGRAGLLGAALPESVGGSGGGFVEICLLLEQQGKHPALVPLLATIVSGAMPIARFGSRALQDRLLPGVVRGDTILTAALAEAGADVRAPVAKAAPDGGGFRLSGVKSSVPFAHLAAAVLVPARTPDGKVVVCVVDPRAAGVNLAREETMNWEVHQRMELADVKVGADAVLGSAGTGREVLDWIVDRTITGLCAISAGACQEAVRITAEYASNRKQFDKPIAMFQAVGQRMADSYIDNEAVNLTMWQAATRLADEMPSAMHVATAKYWAAEGGSRIGHAALHIHGGISIDVDYPIHRYFLWLKQIEFALGGATPQLVRLGELIAAEPA
jgi:3-oxocholest-4-en-26-oyl-CoA dehydrogenase beta subunit